MGHGRTLSRVTWTASSSPMRAMDPRERVKSVVVVNTCVGSARRVGRRRHDPASLTLDAVLWDGNVHCDSVCCMPLSVSVP
jgi:hypothetical protein